MATLQGRTHQSQPDGFSCKVRKAIRTNQPSYMELATEEAQQQASAIVIPAWAKHSPNRDRLNHLQDIKHGVKTKKTQYLLSAQRFMRTSHQLLPFWVSLLWHCTPPLRPKGQLRGRLSMKSLKLKNFLILCTENCLVLILDLRLSETL